MENNNGLATTNMMTKEMDKVLTMSNKDKIGILVTLNNVGQPNETPVYRIELISGCNYCCSKMYGDRNIKKMLNKKNISYERRDMNYFLLPNDLAKLVLVLDGRKNGEKAVDKAFELYNAIANNMYHSIKTRKDTQELTLSKKKSVNKLVGQRNKLLKQEGAKQKYHGIDASLNTIRSLGEEIDINRFYNILKDLQITDANDIPTQKAIKSGYVKLVKSTSKYMYSSYLIGEIVGYLKFYK